jgi:hypothetical protein
MSTTTAARFTADNAPRIQSRMQANADRTRAQAEAATDLAQRDALTRLAESHQRIADRASAATKRF